MEVNKFFVFSNNFSKSVFEITLAQWSELTYKQREQIIDRVEIATDGFVLNPGNMSITFDTAVPNLIDIKYAANFNKKYPEFNNDQLSYIYSMIENNPSRALIEEMREIRRMVEKELTDCRKEIDMLKNDISFLKTISESQFNMVSTNISNIVPVENFSIKVDGRYY